MKKTITLSVLSALGSLLLVGCTAATSELSSGHGTHKTELSHQDIHHTIKTAGEKAGWRMTEFRRDSMIAEKGDDVSTVTFSGTSFKVEPKNSNLEDAIEDALHH